MTAIYQGYWFNMFIGKVDPNVCVCVCVCLTDRLLDDLPINAPVGDESVIEPSVGMHAPLFLHKAFTIEYNKDRVTQIVKGKGCWS